MDSAVQETLNLSGSQNTVKCQQWSYKNLKLRSNDYSTARKPTKQRSKWVLGITEQYSWPFRFFRIQCCSKMRAVCCLETMESNYPLLQFHIPEEWNLKDKSLHFHTIISYSMKIWNTNQDPPVFIWHFSVSNRFLLQWIKNIQFLIMFIINNESNFQYPVASILILLASQNDTIILERHNTYQMNNLFHTVHEFVNSLLTFFLMKHLDFLKAVLLSILNVDWGGGATDIFCGEKKKKK